MKQFICILFMIVFLAGCGLNGTECFNSVREKYPNSTIINVPDSNYTFIVKDNNYIRYVKTMNMTNTNITSDVILFVIKE